MNRRKYDGRKKYVVRTAVVKCDCGSMQSKLIIPQCHGVYIAGKPKLNINDYKEGENISHFGFCNSKPPDDTREKGSDEDGNEVSICYPKITGPWIGGQENDLVDGVPALTDNCKNYCAFNGTITIVENKQKDE